MLEKSIRLLSPNERTRLERSLNPWWPPENYSWWARICDYWTGNAGFMESIEAARQNNVPRVLEILEDNRVEIHTLKPLGAVMLNQAEDEGESYFFQIAPRTIYCLPYQQDRPKNWEEVGWPNTDFDIVRVRKYPWWILDIQCHGEFLPLEREIDGSFDLWELLNRGKIDGNGECIEGTLATLEEDLARHSEHV